MYFQCAPFGLINVHTRCLGFRLILRCTQLSVHVMGPSYMYLPCSFVYTPCVRSLCTPCVSCASPHQSVQFNVRFPLHFLTLKQFHYKQLFHYSLMVPGECSSSFLRGLANMLHPDVFKWYPAYSLPPCVLHAFLIRFLPCMHRYSQPTAFTPGLPDVLQAFPVPKQPVHYNSTCISFVFVRVQLGENGKGQVNLYAASYLPHEK